MPAAMPASRLTRPSLTLLGLAALATFVVSMGSCKRDEKFPKLGTGISSPIDVAVSDNGAYFYVLNSDFDRTYNAGSVLVLNSEGDKITALPVSRLGRSIEVAGNDMLVSIDRQEAENGDSQEPKLLLFDVTQPDAPVFVKEFPMTCAGPINTAMRKNYKYFVLSCIDGALYVGTLTDNRANSTLKKVRDYGKARRALILDDKREVVMGFTTQFGDQTDSRDALMVDEVGYDDATSSDTAGPNEVPDIRETASSARINKSARRSYQFFVYDLKKEAEAAAGCTPVEGEDCKFFYRNTLDKTIDVEQRWIYFKLTNFDGTPDPNGGADDATLKYYRTNFWDAKLDPTDPNVFYLSHRGPPTTKGSPHANQVVKVTIKGDLHVGADGKAPHTEDVMNFERIYGYNGPEVSKYHYPGEIEVTEVQGQKVLFVNHFRDLDNWNRGDVYFSVAAKLLDDSNWSTEVDETTNPLVSWYQLAVNKQGRAISGSFYGNKVILLDVTPGVDIRQFKRIE